MIFDKKWQIKIMYNLKLLRVETLRTCIYVIIYPNAKNN